jgi:hypothetical protein
MTALPLHPHLTHPRTGERLSAIGVTRRGPIWPQLGASPDDPPADPAPPADPPPADPPADPKPDADLGDAGKKALASERDARKAAEKELARYKKAEADKVDADKTEAEKRAAADARADAAELRATRLEVAHEKGLTPAQAKRLVGTNREELEADADEVLRDFPVTPAGAAPKPAPKPDPSQGAKGDPRTRAKTLTEAIAAARKPATG